MSEKPTHLVCAPADAPLAVAGTVFDRVCSRCGGRVMIAPSGQKALRENPSLIII